MNVAPSARTRGGWADACWSSNFVLLRRRPALRPQIASCDIEQTRVRLFHTCRKHALLRAEGPPFDSQGRKPLEHGTNKPSRAEGPPPAPQGIEHEFGTLPSFTTMFDRSEFNPPVARLTWNWMLVSGCWMIRSDLPMLRVPARATQWGHL